MAKIIMVVIFLVNLSPFLATPVGAQPPKKLTMVKVGQTGLMVDAGYYIGMEKGYYAERGIKVETSPPMSAALQMAPLAAGEFQVAGGGIGIPFFNAVARGLPLKVVTTRSYIVPGNDGNTFMVRTDLKDQIKSISDLKGRKFAINATGSPLVYMLAKALDTAGLTRKDLDVVVIPFENMPPAFAGKAIDAAIVVEPHVSAAVEKGFAVRWKDVVEFVNNPNMQVGILFYNKDWAEKNPELARGFMVAWVKSVREYHQALMGEKNRSEVVDLLVKYTAVKDRAFYDKMQWLFMDPNGRLIWKSIENQQEWYYQNKYITQKVNLKEVIDDSYVENALKILGEVPCPKCVKEYK